jgi:hypothetical protein
MHVFEKASQHMSTPQSRWMVNNVLQPHQNEHIHIPYCTDGLGGTHHCQKIHSYGEGRAGDLQRRHSRYHSNRTPLLVTTQALRELFDNILNSIASFKTSVGATGHRTTYFPAFSLFVFPCHVMTYTWRVLHNPCSPQLPRHMHPVLGDEATSYVLTFLQVPTQQP